MPIAKKTDVSQEFLNQLKVNLTKAPEPAAEETPVRYAAPVSTPVQTQITETVNRVPAAAPESVIQDKKEKYADVMNVRLSKGRRNEIKAFCTGCGVTVTQYIESSFEFLAKEVAAGNIVISKGGITKKETF